MQKSLQKTLFAISFFIFLLQPQLPAQLSPAEALKKLYEEYPQEKIYLWLNKPGYIAGETIWFKAYVFSGYDLSQISTNLYVEFLNAEKKKIAFKRYPLLKGSGQGSIDLDTSLPENVYYLRAYTDWMLNFDEIFQYISTIPVYNPLSTEKLRVKENRWTAAAFPEGGTLVDGFETKIAVRLFSFPGLPARCSGYAEEETTKTKIADLEFLDQNISCFTLKPETGKKYTITLFDDAGNKRIVELPEVQQSGAAISAIYNGDSLAIQLRFKNIKNNGTGYSLVGHVQNQLICQAKINVADAVINISLKTADYYNGILHLTLFDPYNHPVSERLVFLNPAKLIYDSTGIFEFNPEPGPRALNEFVFQTDTANWNSYTISVTDAGTLFTETGENLLSSLWLSGDLTSDIFKPADYFNNPDEKKALALDAIMISEKWKRFDWEKILNGDFPEIKYAPQQYLSYTGKVTSKKEIKPETGVSLLLGNPGSSSQVIYTKMDVENRISIDNILFMGDFYSYHRLNNDRKFAGKKINIEYKRIDYNPPYSLPLPANNYILTKEISSKDQPAWVYQQYSALQARKVFDARYKTLQEVIVQSKLKTDKEKLHDKLTSGMFRISHDYIFDFVNEKQHALGAFTIFHWLRQKVSGLDVLFSPQQIDWVPVYRRLGASNAGGILLYLNEGETTASWLNTIPMDNIIMIKVIPYPRSLAFGQKIGMVIAVYTERDSIIAAEREATFNNTRLKGYDFTKEYLLPAYDNKDIAQPEKDERLELLWQPVILPEDSLFRSTIKFYNNDKPEKIRIVIQGFDNKGFPVYIKKLVPLKAAKPF